MGEGKRGVGVGNNSQNWQELKAEFCLGKNSPGEFGNTRWWAGFVKKGEPLAGRAWDGSRGLPWIQQ